MEEFLIFQVSKTCCYQMKEETFKKTVSLVSPSFLSKKRQNPLAKRQAAVWAAHRAAPGWAKLRHAERASVLMKLGKRRSLFGGFGKKSFRYMLMMFKWFLMVFSYFALLVSCCCFQWFCFGEPFFAVESRAFCLERRTYIRSAFGKGKCGASPPPGTLRVLVPPRSCADTLRSNLEALATCLRLKDDWRSKRFLERHVCRHISCKTCRTVSWNFVHNRSKTAYNSWKTCSKAIGWQVPHLLSLGASSWNHGRDWRKNINCLNNSMSNRNLDP